MNGVLIFLSLFVLISGWLWVFLTFVGAYYFLCLFLLPFFLYFLRTLCFELHFLQLSFYFLLLFFHLVSLIDFPHHRFFQLIP